MKLAMSSWLVALRIARRDARRSRGRSALVIAMIALPVLGVGAVDVAFRTFELSPEQAAVREFGQADAAVADSGQTNVVQDGGTGQGYQTDGDHPRPAGFGAEPLSYLPEGTRAVSDRSVQAELSHGDRALDAQLRELAYDDPVVKGPYRQRSGRAPRGPREAALTTALASRLGVHVGDQVRAPKGIVLTVVGPLDDASSTAVLTALVDPGWLPAPADHVAQTRLLVKAPRPLVWDDVHGANAPGIVIYPRHRLPGTPSPSYASGSQGGVRTLAIIVIVAGMACSRSCCSPVPPLPSAPSGVAVSLPCSLAGSAVAELGLVATTPALIGLVGRLGPLLSATPRLALRDAARNRARTAPVVAAVLAAVANSTAVATYVVSVDRYNEHRYTPGAISRTALVAFGDSDRGRLQQVEAQLWRTLPVTRLVPIRAVYSSGPNVPSPDVDRPVEKVRPLNGSPA